jgi:hypothetical protein
MIRCVVVMIITGTARCITFTDGDKMKVSDLVWKNDGEALRFGTIVDMRIGKCRDGWTYFRVIWHKDIEFADEEFVRQYDKVFKSKPREKEEDGNTWYRADELRIVQVKRLYEVIMEHVNTFVDNYEGKA